MSKFHKNEPIVSYKWNDLEKFHPLKTMILIALIGITILFFATLAAFALSRPDELGRAAYKFPKSFFFSTLLILGSSYFINKIKLNYSNDQLSMLLKNSIIAFGLALLFTILQIIGWWQLYKTGIFLQGKPNGAFLYVLSGLHLAHLLGGFAFIIALITICIKIKKNEAKRLLYFSNKLEKTRIETLVLYWHFLDVLWIILFLYFVWCFVK